MITKYNYLLIYVVLFIIIQYFFQKWKQRKVTKMLASFYSKPSLPFIGHVHHIMGIGTMPERLKKILSIFSQWECPAIGWIFHIPVVIIGTPQDMHIVLNTSHDRGLLHKLKNTFVEGILHLTGEKWRTSRRLASVAFSATKMLHYLTTFNKYSIILDRKLESFSDTDEAFDIWPHIAKLNLDLIFQNMGDYKLNSLETGNDKFLNSFEKGADTDSMRYTQPLFYLDFMYNIYLNLSRKRKLFQSNNKLIHEIVRAKIQEYKSNKTHQLDEPSEEKFKSFLEIIIKYHDTNANYTEESIHNDFSNMIATGSITTARVACFTLLMLAMHPESQEKVYQEIRSIYGNNSTTVKIDDINRMVYLEQCINETLRKFPTIAVTYRKHSEDIILNEKQTIPANCHVAVAIYALHHNQQLYPNPEIWDPDRFAPEIVNQRHKHAFLPFGTGPRICIGKKYAMISLKTQLVRFLRSYRVTTDMKMDDIQISINAALKSENGYWLKLWRRGNKI